MAFVSEITIDYRQLCSIQVILWVKETQRALVGGLASTDSIRKRKTAHTQDTEQESAHFLIIGHPLMCPCTVALA